MVYEAWDLEAFLLVGTNEYCILNVIKSETWPIFISIKLLYNTLYILYTEHIIIIKDAIYFIKKERVQN